VKEAMTETNRQWILNRRPAGRLSIDDFAYRETEWVPRPLRPGELILRNRMFLCMPTMRNWLDAPTGALYPSVAIDSPIMALGAAEVAASEREGVPVGARVTATIHWQDYQLVHAAQPVQLIPDSVSYTDALGGIGINALTAYFGLLCVGKPKRGETLVVSAAGGSTGSIVAQIGKLKGCRVIGIAGTDAKCKWLMDQCRIDAALNYKTENVERRLSELCPRGIDVYYDNVGGAILQAAADRMAKFGRIVLCGQIASYDTDRPSDGLRNMMRLIYGSVTIHGFLVGDFMKEKNVAVEALTAWLKAGALILRQDVRFGFKQLPASFLDLFSGTNTGTLLVAADESASGKTGKLQ
jgi:NADPH-dependent curcumin reductase CurA